MSQETGKTVTRNLAVLFVRQLFTWSSTFILLLFLPRHLGPVGYGRYYLGFSIVAIFQLLVDFGGRYSITKDVSRNRQDVGQIMSDSIAIRALLWALTFVGVLAYALAVDYHISVKIIMAIFGVSMLWTGARAVLWSGYQGCELMEYPSYGVIAQTAFITAVGVPALLLGVGPEGFAAIIALGTLVDFAICVKFIPRLTKKIPLFQWKAGLDQLKKGVPYFLNSVFGIIYYRIDMVMLSFMVRESVVGWYGASYRFFDSLMFVPSIFTLAVYPALSRMWGENTNSLTRSMQKSLDFILLVGIPISIGAFAFSKQIVELFYGLEGYEPSVLLLKIFSVGLLLVYIDMMLGSALLASDKQRFLSVVGFGAILVNVAINYILIPYTQVRFGNGGIGSAIATLITELCMMIGMVSIIDQKIIRNSRVFVQMKSLAAGILMVCCLFFLSRISLHWIGQAVVASTVYGGALLVLRAFDASDYALLQSVLPSGLFPKKILPQERP